MSEFSILENFDCYPKITVGMGIGSFAFHVTLFVKSESFPSHFLEEQNEQIAFFNTRAN